MDPAPLPSSSTLNLHCTYSTLHKGSQVVNITSDFFSSVNVTMRHYWSDNAQFLYFSQSNATLSHEHRHHGLSSWIGIMDCHQQCHNGLSSWIFNDNLPSWIVLMDGGTYLVQTIVALNFYCTINAAGSNSYSSENPGNSCKKTNFEVKM